MKLLTNQLKFKTTPSVPDQPDPERSITLTRHPTGIQVRVDPLPSGEKLIDLSFAFGDLGTAAHIVDRVKDACQLTPHEVNMLFQMIVAMDTLRE